MAKRQQLWCEAAQTATLLDNISVQDSAKSPPFSQFFGVDVKYAKHVKCFVVADTNNEVGRTKIDPRGKASRVIHSRDVKWIGKTWANSYKIKKIQRASGYVDTDEDFQLEEEDQDIDVDELEPEDDSLKQKSPENPQMKWKMMNQLLQEQ